MGVVASAAALASGAGTRSRSTLRPCRGSIALAVRALKTRDGSHQKSDPDPFKEFEDLRAAQRCRRRSLPTVDLPRGYSRTSLSVIAASWTSGPCPWQFEPYKAVAALDEISAMTNCGTTRGHYSGSSRMRHRDLRASNVVTLDACIERLCPHPILFQRATLSRLRTERQVGRDDATEHGSTSATGSLRYGAAPFLPLEPPAVASAETSTSHCAIDKHPLNKEQL